MKPLSILIAPSGLKESLEPDEAAVCIEKGIRQVIDSEGAFIRRVPVHDGGEGFCRALVTAKHGEIRHIAVMGPDRKQLLSHFGVIGEDKRTAVLDMASAASLRLVPRDCRDPTLTTSYGVGQLIAAALDAGCTKIIVGCGDSGTSDGGVGMLQALGVRFLDKHGAVLPIAAGGGSLINLDNICLRDLHPRLGDILSGHRPIAIEAVCNIENILCGQGGVAQVYGPQKGATQEQVELLSKAMDRLARAARPIVGYDMSMTPGSGASGGLGAGLLVLGATLRPRAAAIDEHFQLQEVLNHPWDIVFTAEGALDHQSTKGKMTGEVARRARAQGAYVIALVGTIGKSANSVYGDGVSAFTSILDSPISLRDAMDQAAGLLTCAAERTMRVVLVGLRLNLRDTAHNTLSRVKTHAEESQPTLVNGRTGTHEPQSNYSNGMKPINDLGSYLGQLSHDQPHTSAQRQRLELEPKMRITPVPKGKMRIIDMSTHTRHAAFSKRRSASPSGHLLNSSNY